jgi:hypothetical protein
MTTAEKSVGYVFSFAANLANGMALTINGNFPIGASHSEMNVEVDKIKAVFDRQRAIEEVPMLEAQLDQVERQIEGIQLDMAGYAKTHTGKSVDQNHVQRVRAQLENTEADLAKGKLRLDQTKLRAV